MICSAPNLDAISLNGSLQVTIGLMMDNVVDLLRLPVNITVHKNPLFNEDHVFNLNPGSTHNITIEVSKKKGSYLSILYVKTALAMLLQWYSCLLFS